MTDDDTIPASELGPMLVRTALRTHGVPILDRSWITVACPFDACHAAAGQPCTTNGKDRATPHPSRLVVAS